MGKDRRRRDGRESSSHGHGVISTSIDQEVHEPSPGKNGSALEALKGKLFGTSHCTQHLLLDAKHVQLHGDLRSKGRFRGIPFAPPTQRPQVGLKSFVSKCFPKQLHVHKCLQFPSFFWGSPISAWVQMKPPGIGPQVWVLASIYQGSMFWVPILNPHSCGHGSKGILSEHPNPH